MNNLIEELLDICEELLSFVDKANDNTDIKSLIKLEEAANEISKSWSGSWLGYQSRVYYRDFTVVPPGAHFSMIWGFKSETTGDWTEYQYDFVKDMIYDKADNPNIMQAKTVAQNGQQLFEEKVQELHSLFATYLQKQNDIFIKNLMEKANKAKISTGADWINALKPSGKMTLFDGEAASQGLQTPPHISILAEILDIRFTISECDKLAKLVKSAVSHIERQEKRDRRLERIGTNVFIGHGNSNLWRELKDFIQDRLQLPWDEFNRVPVAGITNIARLGEMLDSAAIAFLIMTAEDEQADGSMRARMNVIHEAGLFQGRLGFTRAIVLFEEGCEEFSNIQGLGQIRFPKGNIKAAFEEIRLVLEREGIIGE
ncbi:MAG: nucleotide-binding protein [Anaerolineales bacterium]|nr:nucleotide-binding protein [Anaerolineales bacterium]